MRPIDQRRIIAAALGWDGFEDLGSDDHSLIGVPPQNEVTEKLLGPRKITNWTPRFTVPDYPNDLNAMREAELRLWRTNPTQYWTYADVMLKEVVWKNGAPGTAYQCATAAQRAEAFLKTTGKWAEEENAS